MALPAEFIGGERPVEQDHAELVLVDAISHNSLLAFPLVPVTANSSNPAQSSHERLAGLYPKLKYGIDVLVASVLFLLCLPVFAAIATAVALTSPGGVFFRQTRVGKDMQPFQCLKFRTMVPNAEEILQRDPELARVHAVNWKLDNDPRVTKVGKFLRKTSLDELPQLVNVINGEMSLIGPRPVQFKEIDEQYRHHATTVFSVRPGVTGLWQVSGRSTTTYDARVALDCEYVRDMSMISDFQILAKTMVVVLRGTGAH
ncbi:MAG: sugar transferase [Thermomicrobiales bacterium]